LGIDSEKNEGTPAACIFKREGLGGWEKLVLANEEREKEHARKKRSLA